MWHPEQPPARPWPGGAGGARPIGRDRRRLRRLRHGCNSSPGRPRRCLRQPGRERHRGGRPDRGASARSRRAAPRCASRSRCFSASPTVVPRRNKAPVGQASTHLPQEVQVGDSPQGVSRSVMTRDPAPARPRPRCGPPPPRRRRGRSRCTAQRLWSTPKRGWEVHGQPGGGTGTPGRRGRLRWPRPDPAARSCRWRRRRRGQWLRSASSSSTVVRRSERRRSVSDCTASPPPPP